MGPEVHLQAGLPFEFLLANLALVHGRFIPVKDSLVKHFRAKHSTRARGGGRRVLLPDFLAQMNAFVMDRQVIVAPEALAAFFALVGLLPCDQTGSVRRRLQWSETGNKNGRKPPQKPYRSGSSGAWSGGRGG